MTIGLDVIFRVQLPRKMLKVCGKFEYIYRDTCTILADNHGLTIRLIMSNKPIVSRPVYNILETYQNCIVQRDKANSKQA